MGASLICFSTKNSELFTYPPSLCSSSNTKQITPGQCHRLSSIASYPSHPLSLCQNVLSGEDKSVCTARVFVLSPHCFVHHLSVVCTRGIRSPTEIAQQHQRGNWTAFFSCFKDVGKFRYFCKIRFLSLSPDASCSNELTSLS